MELDDWIEHIDKIHPKSIDFGLTRIGEIAKRLAIDKFDCPVVTVGGTNGKGSCCHFLNQLALNHNLRVGCYTSPHIQDFRERILIDGHKISKSDCVKGFEEVEIARKDTSLTFFEYITLLGLWKFKKENLDLIILEVGLGGRLDAVNIIDNDVSIITSIGIDHTDYLGDTLHQIALEKGGIIRKNTSFICAEETPNPVIYEMAKDTNQYYINKDFGINENPLHFYLSKEQNNFTIDFKTKTRYSKNSIAASICAFWDLIKQNKLKVKFEHEKVQKTYENFTLLGRCQLKNIDGIDYIFDVSHNPQSSEYLAKILTNFEKSGDIYAIFSAVENKDIANIIKPHANIVKKWFTFALKELRGARIEHLTKEFRALGLNFIDAKSFKDSLENLKDLVKPNDMIVVFGSFYTVAEAFSVLGI